MNLDAGPSMLKEMGIIPEPMGTLDELRREGIDTESVGSCAPPAPGVRGCTYWKECRFNQARMTAGKPWKGTSGPRNVGYALKTSDADRSQGVTENWLACHVFVSKLQPRMDDGIIHRRQGLPHELIQIIAHEGDDIFVREQVPKDPNNTKLGYKYVEHYVKVPEFPRPNENRALTYTQRVLERQIARLQVQEDAEEAALLSSLRARPSADAEQLPRAAPPAPTDGMAFEDAEPAPAGRATATAEPVRKVTPK